MGVWGHPRTQIIFLHCAFQTLPSKNMFTGLCGTVVSVFGAPPRKPNIFFGIVHFNQHHSRYPKTPLLANGVQRYGCLGRHPRTQTIFLGTVHFKHHHPRHKHTNTFASRWSTVVWVVGAPPRNPNNFFGIVQFKRHYRGIQKTHLPAYGVQWYGCLGRQPRARTIFFGTVHFKHHHPRHPKKTFAGLWSTVVWVFGAPPQN